MNKPSQQSTDTPPGPKLLRETEASGAARWLQGMAAMLLLGCSLGFATAQEDLVVRPAPGRTAESNDWKDGSGGDGLVVVRAKRPIEVRLDFSGDGGPPSPPSNALEVVGSAIDAHPKRLITIVVTGVPLRFDSLPPTTRSALRSKGGEGIEARYESYLARVLFGLVEDVVERFPSAGISVRGLPFADQTETSRVSNQRYAKVTSLLGAFVLDRGITISTDVDRLKLAEKVFSQAFDASEGRPIIFRANEGWNMVLPTMSLARSTPTTEMPGENAISDVSSFEAGDVTDSGDILATLAVADPQIDGGGIPTTGGSGETSATPAGGDAGAGQIHGGGGGGGGGAGGLGAVAASEDDSEATSDEGVAPADPPLAESNEEEDGDNDPGEQGGSEDPVGGDDADGSSDATNEDDSADNSDADDDWDPIDEVDDTGDDSSDSEGGGSDSNDGGSDTDGGGSNTDDDGSNTDDGGSNSEDGDSDTDDGGADSDDDSGSGDDDAGSDDGGSGDQGSSDSDDEGSNSDSDDDGSSGGSDDSSDDSPADDDDVPGDGAGAGPIDSWEPIGNVRTLVDAASDGDVIDLSGRGFYASSYDDVVRFTNRNVTLSSGYFTGAPPMSWVSIGDGVFEANVDLSRITDQRIYLIDPGADEYPVLAQVPAPPDVLSSYRMTYNQNWWVVNSNSVDNGDVLTADGINVNGSPIEGVRITNPQILSELDAIDASAGVVGLTAFYHAGPNVITAVDVSEWDRASGLLRFSGGSPLNYNAYLRFALSGSPDLLSQDGEYALHPASNKVYYKPANGDPSQARLPLSAGIFRVSGGEIRFEGCTIAGTCPGAGAPGAISGTMGAMVILDSCHLHSVQSAVTTSRVQVNNSIVERCSNRGLSIFDGSTVRRSIVRESENRSAVLVQCDSWNAENNVRETIIEHNLFFMPNSAHGQAVSLYTDAWMNATVNHNIFIDCKTVISFQPAPPAGSRRTDTHGLAITNNLIVYDTHYGPLPGGQSAIAMNGATDEHLPVGTDQTVTIAHNTMLAIGDVLDDSMSFTVQTIDVQKVVRSDIRVYGNIVGQLYAQQPSYGGTGTWTSSNQSLMDRWGSSFGALDLASPLGIEDAIDLDTLEAREATSYMASDGGALGIRWADIPRRSDLESLGLGWSFEYPATSLPTYQPGSRIFFDQDLR